MDDEFAAFMAEVNSIPTETKPVELPKKRGLPAAYRNRTGFYESQEAKTRRIEKQIEKIDSQDHEAGAKPVDQSLAGATISAAPVRNFESTIYSSGPTLATDRKIGLEKVEITPFFGNEQQAFSMKSTALSGTPINYQAIKSDIEAKQKHMSDKEFKAKIESQPTRLISHVI
jgi:hypothetical protein